MAAKKKTKKKIIERKINFFKLNIGLFVLVITLILFTGGYFLSRNKSFMNTVALATTVRPETFTELYFQDHTALPSTVTPEKQYNFSFTIHNLENQDMDYPYEVYIVDDKGNKESIDKNSVTIQNNGYLTIQEGFILNHEITRSEVVVNLTKKNQQIDFWITGKGVTQ